MGLPTKAKTWVISPNNRITYVSLNDTMASLLYGVKAFLVANGYTVKWTCNGTTGPTNSSDTTDRWTSKAAATTRSTIAGAAQSWCVLVDGNGCQILLDYQGASDDVARIAFSPGALYALAGTTTQQPTATDEQVLVTTGTLINATTSADRVWHGWVSSDAKMFRVCTFRSSVVASVWGVELCTSLAVAPAVLSPPVYGFYIIGTTTSLGFFNAAAGSYSANVRVRVALGVVSSVNKNLTMGFSKEGFDYTSTGDGVSPEAQGVAGPFIVPFGLGDSNAGQRGRWCNVIDQWAIMDNPGQGTTTTGKDFIVLQGATTGSGAHLWPWDSSTVPAIA
jgi:hypothetical protein